MMTESHPAFAWIRNLTVPAALAACLGGVVPQAPAASAPADEKDQVVCELARGVSRYVLDAADETEADVSLSGVDRPSFAMVDLPVHPGPTAEIVIHGR